MSDKKLHDMMEAQAAELRRQVNAEPLKPFKPELALLEERKRLIAERDAARAAGFAEGVEACAKVVDIGAERPDDWDWRHLSGVLRVLAPGNLVVLPRADVERVREALLLFDYGYDKTPGDRGYFCAGCDVDGDDRASSAHHDRDCVAARDALAVLDGVLR